MRTHQVIGLVAGLLVFAIMLYLPKPAALTITAWHVCAVAVLMIFWWISEAAPIPVTSLLPLILFPLFNISSIQEAAFPYAHPLIFLFLGGFLFSLALQRWQLHKRIALKIISWIGFRPRAIILGFMLACALLSMWISNTATTLMMLPIGLSVIKLLEDYKAGHATATFATCLMLAIAYSATIGGLSTLIGTPPNAVMAAFIMKTINYPIGFGQWMLIGVPITLIGLPLSFIVLTYIIFPIRLQSDTKAQYLISQHLQELGPVSKPEKIVLLIFSLVVLGWILRPALQMILPSLNDTAIVLIGAIALFVIPIEHASAKTPLLTWKDTQNIPWGILLLFGGGLSLARAITDSGLAMAIGQTLADFATWPLYTLMLITTVLLIATTEIASNIAAISALLPVFYALSIQLNINPLLLIIPASLAASCAFMLPIATPPNAISYASEKIKISQMIKAGFGLNILFVIIISALCYFLVPIIFSS